ncbi:MAG: NDP-hexose 2,3-dehydratase [Flavobacterium sp.]|nr:MAG: NDP-hexose 2,3-dehydratase [Flavobacterium sp.]
MNRSQFSPFLLSALTEENPFITTDEVERWLKSKNQEVFVDVEKIAFQQLENWIFTEDNCKLMHKSGKFFSIDGISVATNWREKNEWEQPIINQPEVGYLGIITKEFNGILYFLLQAKIEPGNINSVQLSPTLQATKSNYTKVHGGKAPSYLEYFTDKKRNIDVLLDQLQSEQGSRFLRKRNRNIIIQVNETIEQLDNFIWLTLGQIKKLILKDNLVNMDTRTVIAGIPYKSYGDLGLNIFKKDPYQAGMLISSLYDSVSFFSFNQLVAWLTELKCRYDLVVASKSLKSIKHWKITDCEIVHDEEKYFKVIAAKITISNREVSSWCQPLVQPANPGIIAFIVKRIYGVIHCLVQAKLECGNFDILELAPTVQCLTGNFKKPDYEIPFLELVLNSPAESVIYDAYQSEEGGRFYQEQNRNMIIEVGDDFPNEVPENYIWMTLSQLNMFMKFNNYLNIQARSLISAISFL